MAMVHAANAPSANDLLRDACSKVPVEDLHDALVNLGCTSLELVLAYMPLFMDGKLNSAKVEELRDDLCRKAADQRDQSAAACGECAGMASDTRGCRNERVLILVVRTAFKTYHSTAIAQAAVLPPSSAAAAAEEAKPLGEKVLSGHWEAAEVVTGGFSQVEPHYRLNDTLVSQMIYSNKQGSLFIPLISSLTYRDPTSNKRMTTILKGVGQLEGDTELMLVQGGSASERRESLDLISDLAAFFHHRSCAMVVA